MALEAETGTSVVDFRLHEVEVRQAGGLLAFTRRPLSVVEMRANNAIPDEPGLAVRVYMTTQKEGVNGQRDGDADP